ncbi:hypothetical protein AGOR_G00074380 [Albula goreensis]|uniref:U5 small nuclear ribonucleoprotein TSSC4 n=1 Tax=Albula goreensis TaxID=1534307 RepID=A0A8T3DPS6_9TELE|nr:hypothetical protein AGOR_G00074380 [Albula goreensis]
MCDQEDQSNAALNKLANTDTTELSDTSSLSDSDSEDPIMCFDAEVENLSSSGEPSPDRYPLGPHVGSSSQEPSFQLKGGSAGFSTRSHSIFDCLESAAKKATPGLSDDNVIDGAFVRPMPPLLSMRKKEGKREAAHKPLSSCVETPESPTHSVRWVKYSLEDVPETSNKQNSQMALQYIQSLQQQKKGPLAIDAKDPFIPAFNQDHSSSPDSKILFSKPKRPGEGQVTKDKTSECQKPEGARKKEVGLFHLDEADEETEMNHPSTRLGKRRLVSEEGSRDDAQPQSAVGFNYSRKVKRKNFRRGAEEDD